MTMAQNLLRWIMSIYHLTVESAQLNVDYWLHFLLGPAILQESWKQFANAKWGRFSVYTSIQQCLCWIYYCGTNPHAHAPTKDFSRNDAIECGLVVTRFLWYPTFMHEKWDLFSLSLSFDLFKNIFFLEYKV